MARLAQKSNARFSFRCYAPGGADGGIHAWYDALPIEVQAEIDATLETLTNSRRPWPSSLFEKLRGGCHPLSEIKIAIPDDENPDADPAQYRILAWEGPDDNEVTLLYGFKKETNDYSSYCHAALRRRDGVRKNGKKAPKCIFP